MNITLAMFCICSFTSGLKLTDCTNVVASKYLFPLARLMSGCRGIVANRPENGGTVPNFTPLSRYCPATVPKFITLNHKNSIKLAIA